MNEEVVTAQLARTNLVSGLLVKPVVGKSGKSAPAIELALIRAESWSDLPAPAFGIRGGSSSPAAIEERREAERVIRMAAKAKQRIPEICKQLEALASELYGHVLRITEVVDPAKYDKPVEPGCQSCARTEGKNASLIGGHWAPIYDKAECWQLCDWCYRHAMANTTDDTTPDDKTTWPPVRACELLHAQSAQAAGRWLAKQQEVVAISLTTV